MITMTFKERSLASFLISIGLILSGCSSFKMAPIYIDESAFTHNLDIIYVAPVIDDRTNKSTIIDPNLIKNIRELAIENLEHHGYHAQLLSNWSSFKQPSDLELIDMNIEDLCRITPLEAKTFLVITINDIPEISEVLPIPQVAYCINATLRVINHETRKMIWEEVAFDCEGGGGLVGAPIGMINMKELAQKTTMKAAFESFPYNGKR